MNGFKLKKLALAIGSLAIMGAATNAAAFPSFNITPTAIPGATHAVVTGLDQVKGGASELIAPTSATTFAGNGVFTLDGFYSGLTDKYSPTLSDNYQLYIKFSLAATLTSAPSTFGQPGSTYTLTTLNFMLYADPGGTDTITPASASGTSFGANPTATATPASVMDNGSADILLGFGSLLNPGSAAINQGGGSQGAALNSTESLSLCSGTGTAVTGGASTIDARSALCTGAYGTSFFSYPVPFYSIAFDEFNNTSVTYGPNGEIALSGGSGSINFAIPEPDSIALLGIAAVAAGLATRRRKA